MSYKPVLTLLILTVTIVTRSAVAQCPERDPSFNGQFTDCGPLDFQGDYDRCCFRGDPHITSFDKADEYRFGRDGNFTAVGLCENVASTDNTIRIYVIMEPRLKNRDQFRVIGVTIIKAGRVYEFFFRRNKKVLTVDGEPRNLPYQDNHVVFVRDPNNPNEVIFRCSHVRIKIDCKFYMVCIWLYAPWYLNTGVCGLCGTYNADRTDDRNCMDNCPDECSNQNDGCNIEEFGNLWKVNSGGDDGDTTDDTSDDDDGTTDDDDGTTDDDDGTTDDDDGTTDDDDGSTDDDDGSTDDDDGTTDDDDE